MIDKAEDRADAEGVKIPNLQMARAYYACVFDADFASADDPREMKIGERRYHLDPDADFMAETHCAYVLDADVSVARIATKGGQILTPVATADNGLRYGQVKDPFGHTWNVKSGAARS